MSQPTKYTKKRPSVSRSWLNFFSGDIVPACTRQKIQEGLVIVQRQLAIRMVRAVEEKLFKARAKEQCRVKFIEPRHGWPFSIESLREIKLSKREVLETLCMDPCPHSRNGGTCSFGAWDWSRRCPETARAMSCCFA